MIKISHQQIIFLKNKATIFNSNFMVKISDYLSFYDKIPIENCLSYGKNTFVDVWHFIYMYKRNFDYLHYWTKYWPYTMCFIHILIHKYVYVINNKVKMCKFICTYTYDIISLLSNIQSNLKVPNWLTISHVSIQHFRSAKVFYVRVFINKILTCIVYSEKKMNTPEVSWFSLKQLHRWEHTKLKKSEFVS
jgi:hypothetical protein